ncbi:MAG: 4a-hydroxytetrahydrobiopterin dehydratase [Candidatus Sungbacteria bacterium]|nr:4a-hydroxytetrahydrobiopterin dehydratase [Candidatus Sungbacteria bacterium]
MSGDLLTKTCKPCEGGTVPLEAPAIASYQAQLAKFWSVTETSALTRDFSFKDFEKAMLFVNRVANLAQQEGHHPDMHIHYRRVRIELTTHAIAGLLENDFILAAKIEKLS